jgi:SAM-dependent methyltransferase
MTRFPGPGWPPGSDGLENDAAMRPDDPRFPYCARVDVLDGQEPRFHSEASARGREPILRILERLLPPSGLVLEVASGTGQQAVFLASRLPRLIWQPSDPDPDMRASIAAWAAAGPDNLRKPLDLDARSAVWPVARAQAVIAVNLIHIAPWVVCRGLIEGASRILEPNGILYLYGAFRVGGRHATPGNAAFDEALRERDPEWGVRDLEAVRDVARANGFECGEVVEMPNNNLSVVFVRAADGRADR